VWLVGQAGTSDDDIELTIIRTARFPTP